MMSSGRGLARRLSALEEIAAEVTLRPIRDYAIRRGLSPEPMVASYERLRAEHERLRAEGLSEREILAMSATRMGITPDELVARCEAIAAELAQT